MPVALHISAGSCDNGYPHSAERRAPAGSRIWIFCLGQWGKQLKESWGDQRAGNNAGWHNLVRPVPPRACASSSGAARVSRCAQYAWDILTVCTPEARSVKCFLPTRASLLSVCRASRSRRALGAQKATRQKELSVRFPFQIRLCRGCQGRPDLQLHLLQISSGQDDANLAAYGDSLTRTQGS